MKILQAQKIMLSDPAHARKAHGERFEGGSAFINGQYCGIHEAAIPIVDMGFLHADTAYDVVSVSKGQFFRLQDHLDRFERSCAKFRLSNPYTPEQTTEILANLIRLAGTQEAYVWWCVTRGVMGEGSRADASAYANCFYAFVIPYLYIASDEQRTRGLDIMVSRDHIRIPEKAVNPTAKNLHWMDMKLSLFEAADNGKEWSVLLDGQGYLTEAPGANIFLIKNGELFTPDTGCLEGITRKTTMDLGAELGMPVHVEKIAVAQLREADEAFMTSTAGAIMPINSVDDIVLGGEPGPGALTTRLHNLYWKKRWSGWHGTAVDFDKPIEQVN